MSILGRDREQEKLAALQTQTTLVPAVIGVEQVRDLISLS
jgi:hypothetical protein